MDPRECERVVAPLPGAVAGVRALHEACHRLFTSTGQPSWEIAGYLRALGIRDLLAERTYGSDLVDRWKTSSAFYTRILEDAGVPPADAVTVDDTPRVHRPRAAGEHAEVPRAPEPTDGEETIASVEDLAARLLPDSHARA